MFIMQVKTTKSNLLKQVDQHEKTFTIIFIVIKCCGLYCTFETSVINPLCICYELASSLDLFSFCCFPFCSFCHLWSLVELRFFLGQFLKSKVKQYPFRDFIICIMKHQWCVHHSILSPFLIVMPVFTNKRRDLEWKQGAFAVTSLLFNRGCHFFS